MSTALDQVIEKIGGLTADEKAFVAHCLISSLETKQDESVDQAWAKLAEERLAELESGKVQGVSWNDIKKRITS